MALSIGNVAIGADGSVVKSGAAGRLFDVLVARATTKGSGIPGGSKGVKIKQALAEYSVDTATWLITEITTFAKAQVTTSTSGLQRMPATTTENTDCKAPSVTKELSIV